MNVFARGIARSCIDELVREARGVTPFYCSHGEQPRKQSAKLYAMSWAGGEPTSMEPLSKEGDKRLILSSVLRIWDRVDHILEQEELVADLSTVSKDPPAPDSELSGKRPRYDAGTAYSPHPTGVGLRAPLLAHCTYPSSAPGTRSSPCVYRSVPPMYPCMYGILGIPGCPYVSPLVQLHIAGPPRSAGPQQAAE